MGAISRLFAPRAARSRPDDWDDYWYQQIPYETASGQDVTAESSLRVSAVMACVRVLAETLGQLPLKLYRRLDNGGKDEAPEHPLYSVLHDSPNRWQTSLEFREMQMGHLALRGNAYSLILPGLRGSVDQLVPLNPDRMQVKRQPDLTLLYLYSDPAGEQWPFPQDKVFHVRGLSSDGAVGMSPIAQAAETVGLAMATEKCGAALFQNKLLHGGIIKHPGVLSPKAQDNIERSFQEKYSGTSNAHKVAVFQEGMEWQPLSMTAEDAQFLETRKFQRNEIASIFRVPPHLIGDLERATFSNIEQQSLEFVIYTMLPWLRRWEQAITRCLIRDPATYFAEFLVDGLLRGDAKTRNEAYAIGVNTGWLTRNEVRILQNMNPAEGLDDFLEPMNMRRPGGAKEDKQVQDAETAPAESQYLIENEDTETRNDAMQATIVSQAPAVDVSAAMKPLIEDAARRIATAEIRALERRAHKASEDRERFSAWAESYCESHAKFVGELLNTIAETYEQVTGASSDMAKTLSAIVHDLIMKDVATRLREDDPVELLAMWKKDGKDRLVIVLAEMFSEEGENHANG